MSFYIAYRTEIDFGSRDHIGHVTVCFMDDLSHSSSLFIDFLDVEILSTISSLEYFDKSDVTVALLDSPELHVIRERLEYKGFTYSHEFIPHITLGKGDIRKSNLGFIGKQVKINSPYIRFKTFN